MDSSRIFAAKILDVRTFDAFIGMLISFSKITGDKAINICITQKSFTFFVKEEPSNLCKMVLTIPVESFQEYRLSSSIDSQALVYEIPDFKAWLNTIEIYRGKWDY